MLTTFIHLHNPNPFSRSLAPNPLSLFIIHMHLRVLLIGEFFVHVFDIFFAQFFNLP